MNLYYLAASNTPQKQSLKLWMKVEELAFEVGQYPVALKAINRIINLDKRQEEKYVQRRILIKVKSGDIDNANSELKKFRTSFPDNLEFLVDYGNCCLSINQKIRALRSYLQYIISTIGYGNLTNATLNNYNVNIATEIVIKVDPECLWPLNNALKNAIDLLLEDENDSENLDTACTVIKSYFEYIKKLNALIAENVEVPLDIAMVYIVCKLRTTNDKEQAVGLKLLHNIQLEIKKREADQRHKRNAVSPNVSFTQITAIRKTTNDLLGNVDDVAIDEQEPEERLEFDETEEELFILRQRCRIAVTLLEMGRNMQAEKTISAVMDQLEFIQLSNENLNRFWTDNKSIAHAYTMLNNIDKASSAFSAYFSYPENENDKEHLLDYAQLIIKNYDALAGNSNNLVEMIKRHLDSSYLNFDESFGLQSSTRKESTQDPPIDNDEVNENDVNNLELGNDTTTKQNDDTFGARKYTRITFTENFKLIKELMTLHLKRNEMVAYASFMLACLEGYLQSPQIDHKKHFLSTKELQKMKNTMTSYDNCSWLDENQNTIRKFIMVISLVVPVQIVLDQPMVAAFISDFDQLNIDDALKQQGKTIIESCNDSPIVKNKSSTDSADINGSDSNKRRSERIEKIKTLKKKAKSDNDEVTKSSAVKRKALIDLDDEFPISNNIEKLLSDPESIEVANELSRACVNGRENSRSIESYSKLLQSNKNSIPLTLLAANDDLLKGRYGFSLGYYVDALKLDSEQPVTSLCLGTLLIFLSCHPLVKYRMETLIKGLACLKQYESTRKRQKLGDQNDNSNLQELSVRQEVLYNFGHAFQDLKLNHIAVKCYSEALQLVDDNPLMLTKMNVMRETAHNLVLILKQSESYDLCEEIMRKYLKL